MQKHANNLKHFLGNNRLFINLFLIGLTIFSWWISIYLFTEYQSEKPTSNSKIVPGQVLQGEMVKFNHGRV